MEVKRKPKSRLRYNTSQRLQLLRKNLSLTQDEVSQDLRVSKQAVSNWETGLFLPSPTQIVNIAKYYELKRCPRERLFSAYSADKCTQTARTVEEEIAKALDS